MSLYVTIWVRVTIMTIDPYNPSVQYANCTEHIMHAALIAEVLTVQCSPCLMHGVVDVDVVMVHKIVILVPVSAPFALKTLELIINNRYVSKKYIKIIFHKLPNHPFYRLSLC